MARQVLTIGGFIVGNLIAPGIGGQIGFIAGSLIGGIVDPVKTEGPRLTDAKAMVARDGVPIPWGDGIFRVSGTMIACQPGKPTEHKTKKRQGKGGGPVQITYTYTRTHAVLICEAPRHGLGITGVRRIWRNEKLIYDATPLPTAANNPTLTFNELLAKANQAIKSKASSAKFAEQITIHNGAETQLPDSTLEAIFGAGEVSANRGIAYMVVEDDDVTYSGGAVPQYEFEVAMAGEIVVEGPIETVGYWKLDETNDIALDSSGNGNDGTWDAASNPQAPITRGSIGSANCVGLGGVQVPTDTLFNVGSTTHWGVAASFKYTNSIIAAGYDKNVFSNPYDWNTGKFNWCLFIDGSDNKLHGLFSVSGGGEEIIGPVIYNDVTYRAWLVRDGHDLIMYVDGAEIARQTISVPYPVAAYVGSQPLLIGNGWLNYSPTNFAWEGPISDCMIVAGTPTPSAILDDYLRYKPLAIGGFDPIELPDALGYYVDVDGVYAGSGISLNSVAQTTITLDDFITAICVRCNLITSDIDVIDVNDIPVTGYVVARPSGGDACIKPLLDAFQIGMYEADGKVRFVKLGANTVADLDTDDLVAQEGSPVTETRSQEVELPRKFNVLYSDPATAYTTTKQTSERTTSDVASVDEANYEIPVVMSADQAAQLAHKKEKAAWIGLLGGKDFVLPDQFSYLTPTDNINLSYRGRTERLCIEKLDDDGGKLTLSTRQDRQSAYSSDRTGTNPGEFFFSDALVGPTIWNVMNLPQLRPQDNVPGVYFSCTGLLPGWRGCELQMSADSGASWISLMQTDAPNAIGYLAASITNVATTASVTMYGTNELESVTTAQVSAGSNRAVIVTSADVCEIITFENAVLDSNGEYDLSTMVRGVLQTTAVSHVANERFVQLDGVNFVPIPLDFSGDTLLFRAVSLGTMESSNGEQTLTFAPAIQVIDGGGA